MFRRFFIYLGIIFFITSAALTALFYSGRSLLAVPVTVSEPAPRGVVLLIPLDSRPPCTDYVSSLAHMAGFQVILPPTELQDDYHKPGNISGLQKWLQNNISRADSAIISIDMLVHGGLLSSRKGAVSSETVNEVISLLTTIHKEHPQVKLYAFNIIPRLLISDDPRTEKYKQAMAEWSMLQETTGIFENPGDFIRLQSLAATIPFDIQAHYQALYEDNHQLNMQLIELTRAGILAELVLGQDDSAPFGLGNMERQRLESAIGNNPGLQKKVFITRGTDEVALSLLSPATRLPTETGYKAYVHYTENHTADTIMPYMPKPLALTVAEKLAITSVSVTDSLADADYILVVHAGNSKSREQQLTSEAERIRRWIDAGYKVALVDLATDWITSQTLLPYLQRNGAALHRLIAYAGWNTASNSVGTAVAQAAAVLCKQTSPDYQSVLYRDIARLEFINERFLDDWYYQKNYRHRLNESLHVQKIDPYNLMQSHLKVARQINHHLNYAYLQYIRRQWQNVAIPLQIDSRESYTISELQIRSSLPWDRTFEIFVETKLTPARIIQ